MDGVTLQCPVSWKYGPDPSDQGIVANLEISLTGGFFILLYYLPIYFQSARGTSAESSGIRSLALIIADSKLTSC